MIFGVLKNPAACEALPHGRTRGECARFCGSEQATELVSRRKGEEMLLKSKWFQLGVAVALCIVVLLLPRPEGTRFTITGDNNHDFFQHIQDNFKLIDKAGKSTQEYMVEVKNPKDFKTPGIYLRETAENLKLKDLQVDYVDGLSPKAKRFLALLAMLIFLFVAEPIPLEITAICIGVFLVIMDIGNVKDAWAPYMHPVVVFIMCCLIFAISLEKAGLTRRLGHFIVKKAGNSVTKFTFIIAIGLGLASSFMHDAAACAVGIVTMLPLMRAANIEPHSNTAKFMMLSLPFACSSGGMGTLVGGRSQHGGRRIPAGIQRHRNYLLRLDQVRHAGCHTYRTSGRWRCVVGFPTGSQIQNAEIR